MAQNIKFNDILDEYKMKRITLFQKLFPRICYFMNIYIQEIPSINHAW